MASGEMSRGAFTQFLRTTFEHLCTASDDGSIHFICMDWRHMREVLDAAGKTYKELKNLCIWTKTNAGMGSFYRSLHELVFVFKNGNAPHVNNVELGLPTVRPHKLAMATITDHTLVLVRIDGLKLISAINS